MQLESSISFPEEGLVSLPEKWGPEKLALCSQLADLSRRKSERFSSIAAHDNYEEMKEGQREMEKKIERLTMKIVDRQNRVSYLDEPSSVKREKK